jgi:hypothetical protein
LLVGALAGHEAALDGARNADQRPERQDQLVPALPVVARRRGRLAAGRSLPPARASATGPGGMVKARRAASSNGKRRQVAGSRRAPSSSW